MIYLDHAAATPLSQKAKMAMEPYLADYFFNPSAPYLAAKRVREAYEDAKSRLAHTIGAKGNDLIITSGATEANNLAFSMSNHENHHALVLATEHASVLKTAENLANSYDLIKVDHHGLIDLADLKSKITAKTALISVSLVNNELGTIQPLADIAEIVKTIRRQRLESGNKTPLYLHSDASQALNLMNINVARLGVDLMTISSAKVYGPKGVGALYVGHGINLDPLLFGGGQERNLRSGTENTAGLIGFAAAAEDAKAHVGSNRKKYENLQQIFKTELKKAAIEPIFLGSKKHQLANFCPVSFPGLDAERIIYKLEADEIYLSTGAACAASKGENSHTLKAIGLSDDEIAGSLRISLGRLNDEINIREAAQKIIAAVNAEHERLSR